MSSLLLLKIPVFFFTPVVYTLIEYFYSVLKNDHKYVQEGVQGAIYNGLILIITETISVLLFLFFTTKLYTALWGEIPKTTLLQFISTLVLIDIMYYFYHRVHHHSKALYTIHRIHHVGTKYNLSLALMLPWIGQASIYLMLVPLIFLHISPYTIMFAYFFLLMYQLFSHISYLQFPAWCDAFLVTPHNHRIHHLHDRKSQMHNYGAVFSVWDRIFATYTDVGEEKIAVFGITGNVKKSFFDMQKETIVQFFKK